MEPVTGIGGICFKAGEMSRIRRFAIVGVGRDSLLAAPRPHPWNPARDLPVESFVLGAKSAA